MLQVPRCSGQAGPERLGISKLGFLADLQASCLNFCQNMSLERQLSNASP